MSGRKVGKRNVCGVVCCWNKWGNRKEPADSVVDESYYCLSGRRRVGVLLADVLRKGRQCSEQKIDSGGVGLYTGMFEFVND